LANRSIRSTERSCCTLAGGLPSIRQWISLVTKTCSTVRLGQLIDTFVSFDEFFAAMVDYNRLEIRAAKSQE
jgi:hypothetical protein